ncbi:AAA family ATPase [Mesorhizobium sp. A623]
MPDLSLARTTLLAEFPYAASIVGTALWGLVGPPGCGKTRLARRLFEELKVPFELISCGGLSEVRLAARLGDGRRENPAFRSWRCVSMSVLALPSFSTRSRKSAPAASTASA